VTVARATEKELAGTRAKVAILQRAMRDASARKLAAVREFEDAAKRVAAAEKELERLEDQR
jgi:predicted proteasome-type protease